MKILVCVKQVPDTSGKVAVNPDGTLNRASMQTSWRSLQRTALRPRLGEGFATALPRWRPMWRMCAKTALPTPCR